MKSDNISKCEESNQKTILITDELPDNHLSQSSNNIRFKFSDNTYAYYDYSSVVSINPYFFSSMKGGSNSNIEILLPPYITPTILMEFLFIIKNGFNEYDDTDNSKQVISLVKVSDFFQNENLSVLIVSNLILEKVNQNNAFDFLKFSYDKMNYLSEINGEFDTVYFDLFYKCLELMGSNLSIFMDKIEDIKKLDKKVTDELIQKMFCTLVLGGFIFYDNENCTDTVMSNEIEGENYFDTKQNSKVGEHLHTEKKSKFISLKELEELIDLLYTVYNVKDFFELMTVEYMSIFSKETLSELNNASNPTFQVKIPYDFENYYEEYPIDIMLNEKKVILIIFYKKTDDSFNVCIKLNDTYNSGQNLTNGTKTNYLSNEEKYCFKIFTFLSIVKINNDPNSPTQTNLKSLSNNKSMHLIFKMPNFKATFKSKVNSMNYNHDGVFTPTPHQICINNDGLLMMRQNSESSFSIYSEDFFTVTIMLKICFVHSVLSSFLLRNFVTLAREPKISKISKQLLVIVIKNKYLRYATDDDIVIGILNWLNDEININEDICELFEVIHWDKVSDDLLFEFLIKYSHMISVEDEEIFVEGMKKKYKGAYGFDNIIRSIFKAGKKIDYSNTFTKMKKNEKFNMLYFANQKKPGTSSNINTSANSQNQKRKIFDDNNDESKTIKSSINKGKNGKFNRTTSKKMEKKPEKDKGPSLANYIMCHTSNTSVKKRASPTKEKQKENETTLTRGKKMSRIKVNSMSGLGDNKIIVPPYKTTLTKNNVNASLLGSDDKGSGKGSRNLKRSKPKERTVQNNIMSFITQTKKINKSTCHNRTRSSNIKPSNSYMSCGKKN